MAEKKSAPGTAQESMSDKVIDPMRRAGEVMKASGEKIAEGSSAVGRKVIDQAEANAREAFAAMRAAAAAKDLSEVMKIQAEFLREQGNRSMAQAREIGEMIVQFGRESAAPFRSGNGNGGGKA